MSPRNRLYITVILACLVGYFWVYYTNNHLAPEAELEVCLFKKATDQPCPSCGSTRSVNAILNGDWANGFLINPIGYILLAIMIVCPPWIGFDYLSSKKSFYKCYERFEAWLSKPAVAWPAVILVILNWIWNIAKDL